MAESPPNDNSTNITAGMVGSISLTVRADMDLFADPAGKILRTREHASILFRINASTKLKKMKRAYCAKIGIGPDAIDFFYGGLILDDDQSATDLYMIDGDVILVKHVPTFLNNVNKLPSTWAEDMGRLIGSEFSDVILIVGSEKMKIHAMKAILSVRSEKFKGLLSANFVESTQPEISMPDKDPELVQILINYLYTDKVSMPDDGEKITNLLKLADEYMLPALKRECEIALLDQIRDRNVCGLLGTADIYNASVLKDVCKQFVLDNFDNIPALGEELKNSPQLLLEITHAAVSGIKRRRIL